MPYYTDCGVPLKDEDMFCPVCGATVAKVTFGEFTISGSKVVERVKEILHEGNVTRVILKMKRGERCLRFLRRRMLLARFWRLG